MGPLCLCCSLYGGPNNSDNDGDDSNDNSFYYAVHTRLSNCCNDNVMGSVLEKVSVDMKALAILEI